MVDEFIIRALIGGILLAIMAGPLGCVLVWKRMAFFGETLAHGALLGVGVGILFKIHIIAGVMISSVLLSFLMILMRKYNRLSNDSMLGILSHSFLAIGLITLGLLQGSNVNLTSYLFGDILSITWQDIWLIAGVSIASLIVLATIWRELLLLTLHEELAQSDGVNIVRIRFIFMLLIALVIAVAMQYVGILLTTSLLIIPAATAYRFVTSPEQMAVVAIIFGIASVLGGIISSIQWDIPTGPAIVVVAAILFILSSIRGKKWQT